jgi:hypothetical protein
VTTDIHDLQAERARLRSDLRVAQQTLLGTQVHLHATLRARGVGDRRGFRLDAASVEALQQADTALDQVMTITEALAMLGASIDAQLAEERPRPGGPVGGWH